ncbi:MAG: MlaE family lipid ABC transporter permease subunit [Planctomycetes bacterium]|nr:MlaE family lipid ABC transporter permease subunit [Planctomycetota bacterium]
MESKPEPASPIRVTTRAENGHLLVRVEGDLVLQGYSPELRAALQGTPSPAGEVWLDLESVGRINTIGAAALLESLSELRTRGVPFRFLALSVPVRSLLAALPHEAAIERTRSLRPPPGILEHVGGEAYTAWEHLHQIASMASQALTWCCIAPLTGRGLKTHFVLQQVSRHGVDAIPIVSLIMFVIGLILALQADYQLRQFAATIYIADLVGVGLTRELGPLMTAVILSGRSAASIAAEIGTMRVTEEIDALVTMGMNPFKYLIAPRILGLIIALPALALLGDCIGILGGYVIGVFYKDIPSASYLAETRYAVAVSDVLTGLAKSAAFAAIIGLVGCYQGYYVRGGPQEIGRATTTAVVLSLFLVIAADLFFTFLFYLFG